MTTTLVRAAALALLSLTIAVPAMAATTAPRPIPMPILSKKPLHTEFFVEVNKKGQVVRVKAAKPSTDPQYNSHTYGDVLQMWIRHPDGSAEVGLYRVNFDFNPKTRMIRRSVSLVKAGGNWGDAQGAALQMMDLAKKESGTNLPALDQITGRTPAPSPTP
ncbi:MAG TPA: hypothetical protein VMS32_06635 [Verrucomicrobiae bacterium]|jgi:hypothetical protein|nr:hypothetical protein [Verrucomicrobiae bacterium]